MSKNKNWRDGLEETGRCPHCGQPVFVRPKKKGTGLPTSVYLCVCRLFLLSRCDGPLFLAGGLVSGPEK
jgi:DNA-directed RNA polymerase subunit RPC12/RpoP